MIEGQRTIEEAKALLSESAVESRCKGVKYLASHKDPEAIALMVGAVSDTDGEVRNTALELVSRHQSQDIFP